MRANSSGLSEAKAILTGVLEAAAVGDVAELERLVSALLPVGGWVSGLWCLTRVTRSVGAPHLRLAACGWLGVFGQMLSVLWLGA